jgi:regulator of sirC expression with transglutaminase-like and TPR domain
MADDPYEDFRQAVNRPEEAIDLARAALAIALGDYPGMDIAAYVAHLDQLSVKVLRRLDSGAGDYRSIAALNHLLFEQEGYRGDRDHYFDPKNSFLNQVIERKRGIPITLSVLYMEVGWRLGLSLQGVGFPGHFLVKHVEGQEEIIIDPFNRGEVRSFASLKRLLQESYGGSIAFHPSLLEAVSKRQILRRMLNNLKATYLRSNDLVKALSVVERLLILEPNSIEDLRDRGVLSLKLECFNQALEDFERYLRLAPEAGDTLAVKEQVIALKKQVRQIH